MVIGRAEANDAEMEQLLRDLDNWLASGHRDRRLWLDKGLGRFQDCTARNFSLFNLAGHLAERCHQFQSLCATVTATDHSTAAPTPSRRVFCAYQSYFLIFCIVFCII